MTRPLAALSLLVLVLATGAGAQDLDRLAHAVLSADEPAAPAAIAALRETGPPGLSRLLDLYDRTPDADPRRLDRACGARDCAYSRLFWYTDFDRALAAARAEGKPILSLRLLGRLDEELSCANSRFFRSTLYPNREISRYLRQSFILHWQSVRPVPVARIDFGDGRTLVRPVTGNSIHYVLDLDGRLVDALPGLYAPRIFLRELRRAGGEIGERGHLSQAGFQAWVRERSLRLFAELGSELRGDLVRLGQARRAAGAGQPPGGLEAAINTATFAKYTAERSLLRALESPDRGPWRELAVYYEDAARLESASRDLVLAKAGALEARAAELTIAALELDIAADTAFNQYRNRLRIHDWLAAAEHPVDLEAFNARVYRELFETPPDDPWLGLAPRLAYSALPSGGRSEAP